MVNSIPYSLVASLIDPWRMCVVSGQVEWMKQIVGQQGAKQSETSITLLLSPFIYETGIHRNARFPDGSGLSFSITVWERINLST